MKYLMIYIFNKYQRKEITDFLKANSKKVDDFILFVPFSSLIDLGTQSPF